MRPSNIPLGPALVVALVVLARQAAAQDLAPEPEPVPVPQVATSFRLEDAVHHALANNERSRKAPLRIEQAQGGVERARGAFLPTLQSSFSGVGRAQEDRFGRIINTTTSAQFSQPILNLSSFPLYSQATHQRESDRWGAVQDRRLLAFDTARAFLTTLTSERVLEAATRRLERARANLQNAEARAATALAGINDATRAQLDLATSLREVTLAEATVARAYLALSFLVGHEVKSPLAPPDRTTQQAESFETNVSSQVKAALDRRPDLRSAVERTEALRASAREPLWRLAPTITLNGNARILPNPTPQETPSEYSATLNANWVIFDAGFRYADRRTRVAAAESQALDESLLRRSVGNEISTAFVTLRAQREALKIADEAVATAQKNTSETEALYRQGLARAIELTDANARRFDAEVNRASTKLSMEQAYLELRFSLGFGPLDEEDPLRPQP